MILDRRTLLAGAAAASVAGTAALAAPLSPKKNLYMGQRPDKPIVTPEELAEQYPYLWKAMEDHGVMDSNDRRVFYIDVGYMARPAETRHIARIKALHNEGRAIAYTHRGVTFLRAA